jgi:hypothetical protein
MISKEKLRELIEQVALIKDLKPKTSSEVRLDNTDQNEVIYDGEEILINKEVNPTLGFELVKIKPVERVCELGCGRIVPDQKIQKRMYMNPIKHWRTRCDSCGLWQKPTKDGFVESRVCQNEYTVYFNRFRTQESIKKVETKLGYRTEQAAVDEDGNRYTEITTNDTIIRKYK